MKLAIAASAVLLTACSSTGFESMLDRLEFEEGEVGCFRAQGSVDAGTGMFGQGNVNVHIVKKTDGDAPDC